MLDSPVLRRISQPKPTRRVEANRKRAGGFIRTIRAHRIAVVEDGGGKDLHFVVLGHSGKTRLRSWRMAAGAMEMHDHIHVPQSKRIAPPDAPTDRMAVVENGGGEREIH
ncbi:MAG: hypothetical protein JXA30_02770 [Deltaproteobacteria bacterium]|nr:hypothetical protein [Deltaproteobacteria bacterium]